LEKKNNNITKYIKQNYRFEQHIYHKMEKNYLLFLFSLATPGQVRFIFICAYQSDILGPFSQYRTRYPRDKVTFAKTEWITNGQFRATCNIGNTTQNGLIWTNCGPNVILSRYFIHHQCYVHGNYQRIIAHLYVKIYLCHVNVYNYLFLLMIWILLEEVLLSCRHIYAYSNE
jgi:hypothetical protein